MEPNRRSLELRRLYEHVLLVEDSIIIAMDAEAQLFELGAERITLVASVDDALKEIEKSTPTLAVLDVKLQGEMSFPIADRLKELKVPFVFATGYSHPASFPDHHKTAPCMSKPYNGEALKRIIAELSCSDQFKTQSLQRTG